MQTDEHVGGDISAYLDGELEPAEARRVEAHLRICPVCAARHAELRLVAQQVRALRAPEVRPEFATRVLARVREDQAAPAGARHWFALWKQLTSPTLIACYTFALMLAGAFVAYRAKEATERAFVASLPAPSPTAVSSVAEEDGPAVSGVVDALVDAGVDAEALAEYAETDDVGEEMLLEDTSEAIDTAFLAMLDAGWSSADEDVFAAFDELTVEEQTELNALLQGGYYDSEGY